MLFFSLILLALSACVTAAEDAQEFSAEESMVIGNLVSYVEGLENELGYIADLDVCKHHPCCTLDSATGEECGLTFMERDTTTLVYPGGETRCIFSYSGDFAFQVIPGDADKLLFYFQGGGACWSKESTKLRLCRTQARPLLQFGLFDRDSEKNRFKGHTVVNVLYCSGDVHGGNTIRSYDDKDGVPVEQRGLANAQSVLDWVVGQQANGGLAPSLSELVISGDSAGSLGTQLWAKQVLNTLKWDRAAVLPDSYIGVFPDGSEGGLIKNFGFCPSGFLSEELLEKCNNGEITLQEINLELIAATPTVPFGFIQSKLDIVQMGFFDAIAILDGYWPKLIKPHEFYGRVNDIMSAYNSQLGNFVTYLVDGLTHIYSVRNLYYSADAKGSYDFGVFNDGPMLREWVEQFPLAAGATVSSVCEGHMKDLEMRTAANSSDSLDPLDSLLFDRYNYCSKEVVPKDYVQV